VGIAVILLEANILISPPAEWPEGEVLGSSIIGKDIMITAQADSLGIPLMTRNGQDFELVRDVVEILEVG
jgi:hypothetical protein